MYTRTVKIKNNLNLLLDKYHLSVYIDSQYNGKGIFQ